MAQTVSFWPGFNSRPVYLRFVMEEVALGQDFVSVLWISPTRYHSTILSSIKITLTLIKTTPKKGFQTISCILICKSQVLNSMYLLNNGVAFQKIKMQTE
jgi:hypothetical protein